MSITVTALTLDGLDRLPTHSRRCVFWEMDPAVVVQSREFTDPVFEKEAWLSTVLLEWGSCGQVAAVDGHSAGCAIYSPPGSVPRAGLFPTSPVSADAVLLTALNLDRGAGLTGMVDEDGLASRLVQAVVADLIRRGVRAIEAFGIHKTDEEIDEAVGTTPRATAALECSPASCMIGADFLTGVGFEVVAPHHRFPRLRLELDRDHGWKADVEHALEQLLSAAALTVAEIGERTKVGAH
ncbi:GNAT family N-acetyltransferase [Antrihabitans cavernicola]|uniref:GNAT family N-acetyltransferase n=1 Tax=Antrihabitans cavernicola TaxID=2495913 RepID=A0A5A7SGK6_9NOCA|nr:GNAT family N-acetyltransferase [Spelaeibacter cavernicola]KAA0024966.1 GNAT family N-acetyltransferase [Spelaeibacter cavernicola]